MKIIRRKNLYTMHACNIVLIRSISKFYTFKIYGYTLILTCH